jgi:hypothetical protein
MFRSCNSNTMNGLPLKGLFIAHSRRRRASTVWTHALFAVGSSSQMINLAAWISFARSESNRVLETYQMKGKIVIFMPHNHRRHIISSLNHQTPISARLCSPRPINVLYQVQRQYRDNPRLHSSQLLKKQPTTINRLQAIFTELALILYIVLLSIRTSVVSPPHSHRGRTQTHDRSLY